MHACTNTHNQRFLEGLRELCTCKHTGTHTPFPALGSSPPVETRVVSAALPRCHGAPRPAGGDTYLEVLFTRLLIYCAHLICDEICDFFCVRVCVLPWIVRPPFVPTQLPPLAASQPSSWSVPASALPSPASLAVAAPSPRSDGYMNMHTRANTQRF